MARSFLSMFAYLVSVSVRLLLAYAIGWPSCSKHAPSPLWEGICLYCDWFPSVIVLKWLGGTLGNEILDLLEAGICHFIPCEDRLLLEHCMEWLSMMAEMWHEVSHVCDHSNETGQLLFIHGGGHLCYSLYFLQAGMHAFRTVLCTKE